VPENVRGSVISISKDLVHISIGLDAGLEQGTRLDVYRVSGDGGKYLGTVVVSTVKPKEAVGEFKPARRVPFDQLKEDELPRKGDTVGHIAPPGDELPSLTLPPDRPPPANLPPELGRPN